MTHGELFVRMTIISQVNTMIRISKPLEGFRETLVAAKRRPKNAELALEWLAEVSRPCRMLTVTGAGNRIGTRY